MNTFKRKSTKAGNSAMKRGRSAFQSGSIVALPHFRMVILSATLLSSMGRTVMYSGSSLILMVNRRRLDRRICFLPLPWTARLWDPHPCLMAPPNAARLLASRWAFLSSIFQCSASARSSLKSALPTLHR